MICIWNGYRNKKAFITILIESSDILQQKILFNESKKKASSI